MPESKVCSKCSKMKPLTEFHRAKYGKYGRIAVCKKCRSIDSKKYYQENLEENRKRNREYQRKKRADPNYTYDKQYIQKIRLEVLQHYGGSPPKCACCDESILEFLTIDHINNDGAEHRRRVNNGRAGTSFYLWLRRNNYPEGFQVLCYNCNMAKGRYGYCPHNKVLASV